MREIIVHYHLFKNAGTSIDKILEAAFGENWVSYDPENRISANELVRIIEDKKDAQAISSHMVCSPLPDFAKTKIKVLPIVFLREPISRIKSAWLFEWKKQKNKDEPIGTLSEYIHEKFKNPRANAIENFQTIRLSNLDPSKTKCNSSVNDQSLLENSQKFIDRLDAFGIVEKFDWSLKLYEDRYSHYSDCLKFENIKKNVTQDTTKTIDVRQAEIMEEIGKDLYTEVVMRNQLDIQLYAYASGKFKYLCECMNENADIHTINKVA